MKVFIGCSGWNYTEWKGKFYPEDIPQKKWLEYYMKQFNSVEVDNTFYRLPKKSTLENWKKQAPPGFNFTLKGSRYVTQMKKLKDVDEGVQRFEDAAAVMKTKLSCILWQLPANVHRDDEKLINFCKTLGAGFKHVIEFRHESWFDKEVYDIMKKYNRIFCSVSAPGLPEEMVVTSNRGYVRFHGKGKNWYDYHYSKRELREWHKKISESGLKEVYIYFNNDIGAKAPQNARQLREMFEKG